MNCTICEKELKRDDRAYITSDAFIDSDGGVQLDFKGIYQTIACNYCGGRISEFVKKLKGV